MNLPAMDTLPSAHFDGVDLAALAGRYGTPLYAYSASAIRQRIAVHSFPTRRSSDLNRKSVV